ARALCRSWSEFLDAAWRSVQERARLGGCVPESLVEGLRRLEEEARRLRGMLESRLCRGGDG
ncbi:MAG: hypothetical protein LRS49_05680, partial [Desulfurococcales archaeon]|nr:hypothetical protein [Desulfurococcales archaeon]